MPAVNKFGLQVAQKNRAFPARRRYLECRQSSRKNARRMRGFTLIEMVVVVSIITILLAIAIPIYSQSVRRARERALRSELSILNRAIVQYTLDKQKAPQGIEDLVSAGYFHELPKDPMTGAADWEVEQDEYIISFNQQEPGITGVHSGSSAIGSDGRPYNTW